MREKLTGEPCEWSTSCKKGNVFLHWHKRKELHDRKYDLTFLCVLKAEQFNPLKPTSNMNYIYRFSSYRAVNTFHLGYKN